MAAAAEHEQVFSANVRRGVSCHSSKEMRKQYVEPANQFDIVSVSSRLADDMTVPTDIQLSRHRPCRHVVAGILGHVSAMLRARKAAFCSCSRRTKMTCSAQKTSIAAEESSIPTPASSFEADF